MVTRLRSEKGSFVQSPKKAFETAPTDCAQWQADLSIVDITPDNRYAAHNQTICASRLEFDAGGGVGGGGQRWNINVVQVDASPFTPNQLLGFSFRQGGVTLSIPTFLAACPIQCVEASGIQAHVGGASIVATGGYSIYENYLRALWLNNNPVTITQTIEMPLAPDLGFGLAQWPLAWTGGALEVVDCPP